MSDRRTTQQLTRSLARRLGFGDSARLRAQDFLTAIRGAGAEEQTESLLSMDPEMLTNAFLHVPPPQKGRWACSKCRNRLWCKLAGRSERSLLRRVDFTPQALHSRPQVQFGLERPNLPV